MRRAVLVVNPFASQVTDERVEAVRAELERGVEPPAPPEQRAGDDAGEGEVSRAPALATPPERVDPPDDLRVEADAAAEPEPSSVHPAERDAARPFRRQRLP